MAVHGQAEELKGIKPNKFTLERVEHSISITNIEAMERKGK